METNLSKGSSTVTAVIVLVVIALVAWVAYTQGLFDSGASEPTDEGGIEVNVGAPTDY